MLAWAIGRGIWLRLDQLASQLIFGVACVAGARLLFELITVGNRFAIATALVWYAIALIAGTCADAGGARLHAEPAPAQRTTSLV